MNANKKFGPCDVKLLVKGHTVSQLSLVRQMGVGIESMKLKWSVGVCL